MTDWKSRPTEQTRPPWGVAVLVILGVLWFSLLGYRDLNEPDEGRYAEIPREMFVTGDWLTPRLNGFKYFEKPPLHYWATAASYHLLGTGAAASRLWTALMGFIGILFTIRVGTRLFGSAAGWSAGLILASMLLYPAMGHFNTLDMSTSVWLTLGMGALLLAQSRREEEPDACRRTMLLGWAALAGACLSKGLIGLALPAASLLLYSLWQRDWALWRHLNLGWGVLLFFALAAPWFVGVSLANPEFPHFFFIHEHLERYASTGHGRTAPWWFFVMVLLLGSVPWTHRLLLVLFRPGFSWRGGGGRFDPIRLLWVYTLFVVFFFSLSQSKLIPYILPVFPPLALLLGRHLFLGGAALTVGRETRVVAILAALMGVAALHLDLFADARYSMAMLLELRPWLLGIAAVLGVGVGFSLVRRCQGEVALVGLSLSVLIAFQGVALGAHTFSSSNSSRDAAEAIQKVGGSDMPIYSVDGYFQSLPFYLGRTITLVRYMGELEFGIRREPEKWIADPATFQQRWMADGQAVALFRRSDFKHWSRLELPMRVIHEDARRVVVARR